MLAPQNGIMAIGGRTMPRGIVWVPGFGATPGAWFISDANPGGAGSICRLDPPPPGSNAAWTTSNCNATAASGGQMVVGNTTTTGIDGSHFIYLADNSSKSTRVIRYRVMPSGAAAGETLTGGTLVMNAPNTGGTVGRTAALALSPNQQDLYIGYIKSGDIMKIPGAQTTNNGAPPIQKVGNTSDGRGVESFVMFNNDLFVAELGGQGLSRIIDPSGVTRTPCGTGVAPSPAQCTATPVPGVEPFPRGLATDGSFVYIGHGPNTVGTPSWVSAYNPNAPTVAGVNPFVFSQKVTPYTEVAPAPGPPFASHSEYVGPVGIGVNPATGQMLVGDDPYFNALTAANFQGHIWNIPNVAAPPTVTAVAPNAGPPAGGTPVTVTGTGFDTTGLTSITFGGVPGAGVVCGTPTSCTVTSPPHVLGGPVDVVVTVGGQQSAVNPADVFTYVTGVGPVVTGIGPVVGLPGGGTLVTVTGSALTGVDAVTGLPVLPTISFGTNQATSVSCASATTCTVRSPAGTGTVQVQASYNLSNGAGLLSSPLLGIPSADAFTYVQPTGNLYAWGITAPKGGVTFLPQIPNGAAVPAPGAGSWWASDHGNGFCRLDPVPQTVTAATPMAAPGNTIFAANYSECDDGSIGSPGQAVYDPNPVPAASMAAFLAANPGVVLTPGDSYHYVYVPDNAVRSTAVWRLTYDATTQTLVNAPPEAMIPLADVRTLKPNGMALGPDGNLYVTDLVEKNIRQITNPNGDPRLQTVGIVAVTGDGRGANGTIGFIGTRLYISENRAAAWFDTSTCPPNAAAPCATNPINLPAGVFVAGVATDPARGYVYASDSPGGTGAVVYRFDNSTIAPGCAPPAVCGAQAVPYVTVGNVPAAGTPNLNVFTALTARRPLDPNLVPGGTTPFAFVFGLNVDGNTGALMVTEDPSAGARSGRGRAWTVPLVP